MAVADTSAGAGAPKVAIFNDPKVRGAVIQIVLIALIVFLIWGMVSNAATNLAKAGIASGFGFLGVTAGFGINFSPFVDYSETSTYGTVYWVGLQNTLIVAVLGIIFATVIGFLVGVARLSHNWVVSKNAYWYVEIFRNIPLLLQIFIW